MRRSFVSTIVATLAAGGAMADERVYDLDGFTRVEVSNGVSATVVAGEDFSVVGEAVRGDIERLRVEVEGDRLLVGLETDPMRFDVGRRDRFGVRVAMPEVAGVEGDSGSSVELQGGAGDVALAAGSGAAVRARGLGAGAVTAGASGGASLRLDGSCTRIEADASSGASLDADGLDCTTAEGRASAGASLSLRATDTAALRASSGASLSLSGGAEVTERDASSGASIRVR